jgi:type VI secretion system protein ImpF
MPRGDGLERTAKPSIIDRLVDLAPAEAADRPMTRDESVRAYRSSILRDLEWLLNTRRTVVPVPESLTNVRASTFNYGLPDVSSLSADSMETRADLVRQIERTIRDFEPRLLDVRVTMSDDDRVDRQIRFVIEGLLDMEPNPERVVFDTVLEMSSGDFSVRASS